ncbi:TBC1 domain family member 5 [Exophiala dermatitidis]
MRDLQDIQRRWTSLFSTSIGVDLRQALRDGEGFDPCEDGLRSVCWKAFLLYGPLSQASWSKPLAESRSAYVSLRDHFLRFIEHPNDLHSSADPLADDENSPWSTLRQDEINREEIFQDVTRCMQDNYFFKEPSTQKRLLDILFIYSKLNPDVGYRQGMHELLAPILWVIHHDAIDTTVVDNSSKQDEGADFMMEVLDAKFVEHDAFNLFCALMQTMKASYEIGDGKDSSPIVARSQSIHDEILASVDPELALHLHVIGILPQIYSIRWIRLLFGREFEFKDVLRMWDLLFAENLRPDIVDVTCVAMLLRSRWSLVEADYTAAITALTHYSLPTPTGDPRSLVRDAIFLDKTRNSEAGAMLIQYYSGRRPKESEASGSRSTSGLRTSRKPQHRNSPSASPGRFSSSHKHLEGLFQEVTGGLQRRTEGWNVSKAVRTAVGEVRRNMNQYQVSHSRNSSSDTINVEKPDPQRRLQELQERNRVLAKMLEGAIQSLRSIKLTGPDNAEAEHGLNVSLAKIQFVSMYLSNPDTPIPKEEPSTESRSVTPPKDEATEESRQPSSDEARKEGKGNSSAASKGTLATTPTVKPQAEDGSQTKKPATRPSLMDSSFSFMLGEGRHRSSFVSSAATLPEQRRDSESRSRPKQPAAEKKTHQQRKESESEDDGFTLANIQGAGQG